jgi:hypothetical protein
MIVGSDITDSGLVHLSELNKLQRVWLVGTQVTEKGVAKLRTSLPRCKVTLGSLD